MNLWKALLTVLGMVSFGLEGLAFEKNAELNNRNLMAAALKQYKSFSTSKELLAFIESHLEEKDKLPFRQKIHQDLPAPLPTAQILGPEIQFWQDHQMTTVKLIESDQLLFSINGKQIQIQKDRTLLENLNAIEKLLPNQKSAAHWLSLVLPQAQASPTIALAAMATLSIILGVNDLRMKENLDFNFVQLNELKKICTDEISFLPFSSESEKTSESKSTPTPTPTNPNTRIIQKISNKFAQIENKICGNPVMQVLDRASFAQLFSSSHAENCTLAKDALTCAQTLKEKFSENPKNRIRSQFIQRLDEIDSKLVFPDTQAPKPSNQPAVQHAK